MIGPELGVSAVALRGAGGPALLIDFIEGQFQTSGAIAASFVALSGVGFTRTGAGTGLTQAGGVTTFAADVPRITSRGLLLESARTNLLTHSSLSDGSWGLTNASKTTGQTDPLGGTTATTLTLTASAFAQSTKAVSLTTATHTLSGFVRVASGTKTFRLKYYNGTADTYSSNLTATTQWQPFSLTFTGAASGHVAFVNASGGGAGDIIVALAQVEAGGVATSPIVTNGATATCGADAATVTAPAGTTTYEAVYGVANTPVSGSVTPGANFALVAGRPWIGLNNELKRLVMR